MEVVVVYGPPCSGKSTYVKKQIGNIDLRYDYDELVHAVTNRVNHETEKTHAHHVAMKFRRVLSNYAKQQEAGTLYITICWPSDALKEELKGRSVAYYRIRATQDECYANLDKDETRPDKHAWRELIDEWFAAHDTNQKGGQRNQMIFYNFIHNEAGGDELHIDGEIASEDGGWWGPSGQIVARRFRQQLAHCGDVTVFINSPGGDVFAGAEIYTALREHKGKVTVKISGIAASAASVIAMAGDEVLMSPVAYMMIHDPWTYAMGNAREMEHQAQVLREIGEGLIAAYTAKTGKSRDEIADLLAAETYMNAEQAVREGFADGILYEEAQAPAQQPQQAMMMQARRYGPAAICAMVRAADAAHAKPAAQNPDAKRRAEIAQRAQIIADCGAAFEFPIRPSAVGL